MVKLTDIIRKQEVEKSAEKPGFVTEAVRTKEDKESLSEVKKVYEDLIFEIKEIMNELREGKAVEGRDIANIA